MPFIEFVEGFLTGIKEIDEQHKKLFYYLNNLHEINKLRAYTDIRKRLEIFLEYLNLHLETEENLMKKMNIPNFEDHILEHQKLRNKINEYLTIYSSSNYTLVNEICNLLKNFYKEHIIYYDKFLKPPQEEL